MKTLCLVGRSGVGKTTLLERAVRRLRERGLTVLAIKSSHHHLEDKSDSDSHRLAQADASGVGLLASNGCHLYLTPPLRLEELLPLLAPRYHAALIEGGKSSPYPKVELLADQPPLLAREEVVGRLQRGVEPACQQTLEALLELWEREGQSLETTNI